MKNKKIILIISIIIIIGIVAGGYYIYKEKKEITYKDTDAQVTVYCSKDYADSYINEFTAGDNISCWVVFDNLTKKDIILKEITATFELSEDLEYKEISHTRIPTKQITARKNEITVKDNTFKDTNIISSSAKDKIYALDLNIKPIASSDKITIKIKDIKIKAKYGKYYKAKDYVYEKEIKKDTNYQLEQDEETNVYTFYKYENGYKKINEYTCESDSCITTVYQCFGLYDLENGKIAITDGNKIVFYDFNKGKYGEYGETIYTLHDENYEPKYYYVSNLKNNKYGIIDTEGKIIKDFTLEKSELTSVCNLASNSYSIEHDLLVAKKDNKYGIIKLTKDENITDYIYDDVRVYNDKVYKAKIDGTWFLYDYNNLEKTHETGYKEIFIVTDNIMVVQKDNYLYIQDYEGHNLIEDKIETYIDYNENACCGASVGTYAEYNKETKKIEITVDTEPDSENKSKIYLYEYDIENKKLTKKDSN